MKPSVELRDYQIDAIEELRQKIREGHKSIVLVAPTGSGKTTIAAEMIRSASSRGNGVQFLAHRKELIEQCSARLDEFGIDHSIIMGNHPRRRPWLRVYVSSVPTLAKRSWIPPAKLIFIDEAHRALAKTYLDVMERYSDSVFVLLTATPWRLNGQGMGDIATAMVECPPVFELTERGFLVPARVFAPSSPDLAGVHMQQGDYKPNELAAAVDKPVLVGSVVEHYAKLGEGTQNICFGVNVPHSQHLAEMFNAAGIKAEHVDGDTRPEDRTKILRRYKTRETRVLCNVQIATEGYDDPQTGSISLARPTMSLSLFLQMVGRGLRPYPGKEYLIVLDHASCTKQHGFVDDVREWSLSGAGKRKKDKDEAPPVRMCLQCWRAFRPAPKCPHCGFVFPKIEHEVKTADGELVEITESPKYEIKKLSGNPLHAWFQEEAVRRGKTHRWAWAMRDLFERGKVRSLDVPPDVVRQWEAYRHGSRRRSA